MMSNAIRIILGGILAGSGMTGMIVGIFLVLNGLGMKVE
jgi:hypothetical protein